MATLQDLTWVNETFGLSDKVAVVVGGTSGIGRVLVDAFRRAGASVVASSRRQEAVEQVANELEDKGCETVAIPQCHLVFLVGK